MGMRAVRDLPEYQQLRRAEMGPAGDVVRRRRAAEARSFEPPTSAGNFNVELWLDI
jgi:hypothetical protein